MVSYEQNTIPGNTKLIKLFFPKQLHNVFIKDQYDIEVSYLEGPTARILSGCCSPSTKLINWVHVEQRTPGQTSASFRNGKEAEHRYGRFDRHIFVAETVKGDSLSIFPNEEEKFCDILYKMTDVLSWFLLEP